MIVAKVTNIQRVFRDDSSLMKSTIAGVVHFILNDLSSGKTLCENTFIKST